jgi:hypothetical protein
MPTTFELMVSGETSAAVPTYHDRDLTVEQVETALMVEQVEMEEAAAQVHRMESTAEMEETAVIPIAPARRVLPVALVFVTQLQRTCITFVLHPSRRTGPLKAQAAANTNPLFIFRHPLLL